MTDTFWGLLIPFLGTSLGAACVFFMQGKMNRGVERGLTGFASGVMVAASIWSLLIPALDECEAMGRWAFLPPVIGFGIGMAFLLLLDHAIPHLHMNAKEAEGPKSHLARTTMLVLAVTLHNIAGFLSGHESITVASAMALSLGIAIQNFPEGAIISMPLKSAGMGRWLSFAGGVLSGIVEPIGAVATILLTAMVVPMMPYLLSFAAGAMMYVVVEELIPEMSAGEHSDVGVISFAIGFMIMMALDVALG